MKRLFFITILLIIFFSLEAQFSFTKDGLKDRNDLTKTYVVLNFDSISKQELYTKGLVFVANYFVDPKSVVSKVDNEAITINGIYNKIPLGKDKNKTPYDELEMNYTMNLNFKDNKVRVSVSINKLYTSYNDLLKKRLELVERGYGKIFDKDGNPHHLYTIESIENYFNLILEGLQSTIIGKVDDW